MSENKTNYTTGEVAKLCGVSVRTVQYYDTRGILTPQELSEGGRRLYAEADLQKMKIICFLRELGLPLGSIGELMREDAPEKVISILLDRQENVLREEIAERQEQLSKLESLSRELRGMESLSVESIGDVAHIMKNKKKLRRLRGIILGVGLVLDVIEVSTLILWIQTGIWLPFVLGMCVVAAGGAWISWYYYNRVAYICPECHTVFKPRFGQMFWAPHTPNTRKLTCTKCDHKGFCVETYGEEEA